MIVNSTCNEVGFAGRAAGAFVLVLFALFSRGAFAGAYTYQQMVVSVVDAAGNPSENAIVLVTWAVTLSHTDQPIGMANAFEGVTNSEGVLTIPAWTGRVPLGEISLDQPIIRVFKPGLMPFVARNKMGRPRGEAISPVDWGQNPVVLSTVAPPASGEWTYDDAYLRGLQLIILSMMFYAVDTTCLIERFHLMRDAVNRELDAILTNDRVGLRVPKNRSGCSP